MEYYGYGKEELQRDGRIPVRVLGERGEVFYQCAEDMLEIIRENGTRGRRTTLIVPVGPVGQYPIFVRLVNERRVSLKNVWFINMDEYLDEDGRWLDIGHRLSFRGYMQRTVYDRLDPALAMPPEQRVFPDPGDPDTVGRLIDRLGGVDACFGGIGINGHVAFNEPEDLPAGEFLRLPTRVGTVTRETLAVNCIDDLGGAIDCMPRRFVTLGMREIWAAKRIRLYCLKPWHNAVVHRAAFGDPTPLFPVTLLQGHPDIRITIPESLSGRSF